MKFKRLVIIFLVVLVLLGCGLMYLFGKDLNILLLLKIKFIVFYEIDVLVKIGVVELLFKIND